MITACLLVDESVPGAAVVTGGVSLGDRLAAVGEHLLDVGYLRYKPGTSLVAALDLASGPAFAYAVSPAARPKLAKTIAQAPPGSVLVDDTADDLLVARPAADRDLPALADLERALGSIGVDRESIGCRSQLAYKPQRRWVGRLGPAGRHLVARAYRPADLAALLPGWRLACLAGGDVRVPALVAVGGRRGLAVTSWLGGTPLDRLVAEGRVPAGVLSAVGRGLAGLHAAGNRSGGTLVGWAPVSGDERIERADAVAAQLSQVWPAQGDRVRAVVDWLVATVPAVDRVHPVHGDFSTDQVIVDPAGRIGLTDWDRAGWDDPAVDLGSLRAAGLPAADFAEVLTGYASVRDLPTSIDWQLAWARLLRLSEPLRQGRADWRHQVGVRLAELEGNLP